MNPWEGLFLIIKEDVYLYVYVCLIHFFATQQNYSEKGSGILYNKRSNETWHLFSY